MKTLNLFLLFFFLYSPNILLAGEGAFIKATKSIDVVIDAEFVGENSFFMVVKRLPGMDWNEMAETMCKGKKNFGLGWKTFGITVWEGKKKVGKAYCKRD